MSARPGRLRAALLAASPAVALPVPAQAVRRDSPAGVMHALLALPHLAKEGFERGMHEASLTAVP